MACVGVPWLLGKRGVLVCDRQDGKGGQPRADPGRRATGLQAQPQEKAWPVVSGVMVGSNGLYVAVLDRGWIRVGANTPGGDIQLEDGTIVRRADVMRGGEACLRLSSAKRNLRCTPAC